MAAGSERISPTAYGTAYVWQKHGLSHSALAPTEGRWVGQAFRLLIRTAKLLGGVSIEAMLLARHKGIDAVLARAIEEGRVSQVIEIAAGLSARGYRFMRRYGDRIDYVEADLPGMAALKRRLLREGGLSWPRHRVVDFDALKDDGKDSLAGLAGTLDSQRGLAIITEGLMVYFDTVTAEAVWRRIAANLRRFPHGVYLADMYFKRDHQSAALGAFRTLLGAFVRGGMTVHFDTPDEAATRLRALGFASLSLHATHTLAETRELSRIRGGERVRILEAHAA